MKYDPEILLSLYLNDNEAMTDEQLRCLQSWLNASFENARHFVRVSYIHRLVHDHLTGSDLQKRIMSSGQQESNNLSKDGYCEAAFWDALSQHEKEAETVVLPPEERPRELVTGVRQRKAMLKVGRRKVPFGLWFSLGSLAALFLMAAYVILNPRVSEPVATLTDSYEANWQSRPLEVGSRLTNAPYLMRLHSGYAKLELDNGAEVIVEGPAEFQLISAEYMRFTQGKLTAFVPPAASGFRVDTPAMSVIDLGTEFSIKIGSSGVSAVHMYQGKASLQIGDAGRRKDSHILTQGQARSVDPRTGRIEIVPLEPNEFVRRFDSEKGFVWRGAPINLSSIVAGGDGFNMMRGISGINPKTGEAVSSYRIVVHRSTATYSPVPDNPFVDGVFIPDGGLGKTVISSAGHLFEDCPDTAGMSNNTTGMTSHDILVFCDYDDSMIPESRKNKLPVFLGAAKGTAEEPAVLMHSNVGITFDLHTLKAQVADTEITRFVSSFGLSSLPRGERPRADVWVLVDGQMRFSKRELTQEDGLLNVGVEIAPHERFLTIAVTDAAHTYEPGEGTYADDYVYLVNPRLTLTGHYEKN